MFSNVKMRKRLLWLFIFLNLIFFGMCCYAYLMWSQYLTTISQQLGLSTLSYDDQIYLYNRGYLPTKSTEGEDIQNDSKLRKSKRNLKTHNITYKTKGSPRFQSLNTILDLDTFQFRCFPNDNLTICEKKTSDFKQRLLTQLNNVLADESNVLKKGNSENPYNVAYRGTREDFRDKSQETVLCELRNAELNTLRRSDFETHDPQRSFWPKRGVFENKQFNSCVVVASSGSLKESNLGYFIDSHDIVLRFNHAPTLGFEKDVGRKTSIRVVNSQVVTKREFKFLKSSLYKNITLIAWDPSNYTSSLDAWVKNPEFNFFPNIFQYRRKETRPRLYVLNPLDIWDLWDFLQRNSPSQLRKNPPSSGFLGLRLLLPVCTYVDIVEYVPSTRATRKCHYYDLNENPACTFGVWHPLAAEKLLTYYINSASDYEVFQNGFVRLKGFRNLKC